MDDAEDDARSPGNEYGSSHEMGYGGSSSRQKLPVRTALYSRATENEYIEDDDDEDNEEVGEDDEDEEQLGEEDIVNNQSNGIRYVGNDARDKDDEEDDVEDTDDDDEDDAGKDYGTKDDDDLGRHPKNRKIKSLISSYEFAPRIPNPPPAPPSAPKSSFPGRNPLTDWTERETFVLLDAWGDKFLQHGRKSLRSDEWHEVAERVSEVSKIERTDTQCRNRLDTLKKKYKKEKSRLTEAGVGRSSKWVYFKKMDMLMSTSAQQGGLSCGLDSGEYIFMNPKVYLNRANGLYEMQDGPVNSGSANDGDDSDGLPPKKRKSGRDSSKRSSFSLLADTIQKFSHIYEKIEKNKRQQMLELEKMRMDFLRDLEMQKRQIMERAQAEIAKMQQDDGEDNNISTAIGSG